MKRSMRMLLALAVMVSSIPFSISPAQAQPLADFNPPVAAGRAGGALPAAEDGHPPPTAARTQAIGGAIGRYILEAYPDVGDFDRSLQEILDTSEAQEAIRFGRSK
ncbi:MAG: hypothetical protein LBT58_01760 [Endomicrobium sp.]|jgi:hypothetical protein|nr:hypothetical protein [Endomicrobium sp.]